MFNNLKKINLNICEDNLFLSMLFIDFSLLYKVYQSRNVNLTTIIDWILKGYFQWKLASYYGWLPNEIRWLKIWQTFLFLVVNGSELIWGSESPI